VTEHLNKQFKNGKMIEEGEGRRRVERQGEETV
jgi:hypothetical protein